MLLTLPMAEAIKQAWPGAHVAVLASPANAEAARHHPDVDQVWTDPLEAKGSGLRLLWPLVRLLRNGEFDATVVVHPTPRLALAAWMARIPLRVGTAYRMYSPLFNARIAQHRRGRPVHESRFNLELLRPLGIALPDEEPRLKWTVSPQEQVRVAKLRRETGLAPPYVVVHPGSGGSAWNWPRQRYVALAQEMVRAGYMVAVTGSAREGPLVESVARQVKRGAVPLAGRLSLGELAVLVQQASVFVGASTGPTHLAAMLGTPVVALYAPLRSQAPERWRPLGPHVTVLQPDVGMVCRRCHGPRCPFYLCMEKRLEVARVWEAVRSWLERERAGVDGGAAQVSRTPSSPREEESR